MAKKILSWVLVCSLLLTCFSGIALVTAADEAELPTPYFWYTVDQTTGEVTASRQVNPSPLDPYVSTKISDEDGYGLLLTGDWQGIWFGSDDIIGTDAESVTLMVEYYIDTAKRENTENFQLFRVMPAQNIDANGVAQDGELWFDYFLKGANPASGTDVLVTDTEGVVTYTYSKEQMKVLLEKGISLGVKGCLGGTNCVYIKSIKIVDTKYVASADHGYAFTEFAESPVSDYYPNITAEAAYNMNWADKEEGVWRYYNVYGEAQANDPNVDKPIYIKVYAAEGYENASVHFGSIDATDGNGGYVWSNGLSIKMTDGVGGAFVNAGLLNRLNQVGAMRTFNEEETFKISRVEVYDVATYCNEAENTAEMKALFHQYMKDSAYNLATENAVEPTDTNKGNSGLVTCATCGEILANYEDVYKAPYAWFDTKGGVLTTNGALGTQGGAGRADVMQIPGTDEYGIRLDADWSGFYFGGEFMKNVPEGQSVTMAVEYYITGSTSGRQQLFRYQSYIGMNYKDMFSDTEHLVGDTSGLFFHTYTAEEMAAIGSGDMRLYILGCAPGAERVYIQSMKLINTNFVHPLDVDNLGYSVADYEGQLLCDYYPEIKQAYASGLSSFSADFEYFKVSGAPVATDSSVNKPVYIKFYTKEGYENTTITLNQFEVYTETGRWACDNGYSRPTIVVTNGEGGVLLPETSFTNANNGGSFRIPLEDKEKIARIEVYDANAYCTFANATADKKAGLHAAMMDKNLNLTVEGAVEATDTTVGLTGTVYCALCGDKISDSKTYYKNPYAWFDTANGVLVSSHVMQGQGGDVDAGTAGHTNVMQIPGTNEYGIRLESDWSGFWIGGKFMNDVPAGQSVTMVVEYYITGDVSGRQQMFRYQSYSGMDWRDMFTDTDTLVGDKSGLFIHTYTAEEMDAIRNNQYDGDMRFTILGCGGGAQRVYIQSLKLVSTNFVEPAVTDTTLTYADIEGDAITPYYPDVKVPTRNNVTYSEHEQHPNHPDREWLYRYFQVYGDVRATDVYTNKPVYVKLYAAEGYENATVSLGAFEVSDGVNIATWNHNVGYDATVLTFVDGEAGVYLPATCFNNGLNAVGSLRVWWEDVAKIGRIELYDVATACNGNMTNGVEDAIHAGMVANDQNLVKEGDAIYCGTCGDMISEPVVEDCEHAETTIEGAFDATCGADGYTGNTVCANCGALIEEGSVIEATGAHTWDDGVITTQPTTETVGEMTFTCTGCGEFYTEEIPVLEPCKHEHHTVIGAVIPTCTTNGYTGDTVCAECGEVLVAGEVIAASHAWGDDTICDVCGEDSNANAYTYTITDGKVTITKVDTSIRGAVVIPSTIEGYPVTEIAINAFKDCVDMTSVVIPESIETIGYYAFRNCTGLTTVYYNAANCTSAGVAAYPVFEGCSAFTTLYVGKAVTQIPAQIFRAKNNAPATALTTVYLTKNTTVINRNAFHLCDNITDVYFVGSAGDWTNVDVKSYNTGLTNATFSYNAPCFDGHDWTADCDSLCDLCGEKRDTVHADLVDDAAKDPTCDATGLTAGSHCAVCGNVVEAQKIIPALGHTWNEGEVLTEPTEEADGEKKYTCTVCGGEKIVPLNLGEVIDGYYYYKGVLKKGAGLVQVEDALYYVTSSGAVKTGRFTLSASEEFGLEKGAYYFFADGKLNLERGVYEGLYYNDLGIGEAYAGLIEWNGAKYYVNDGGKVMTGRYFITKLNGLLPKARAYTFYEDGRMLEEDRIYDVDGFYYEDGLRVPYAGMVLYEDNWYYVSDHGAYVKNKQQILVNVNNSGLAKSARCYFDENGHMVRKTVVSGVYYDETGAAPSYAGVVADAEGNLYYVSGTNGKLTVGKNVTISAAKTNGLCAAGKYTADANGVITPAA